jgi:hypothetical protein
MVVGRRWIVAVGALCCALLGMSGVASAAAVPLTNVVAKPIANGGSCPSSPVTAPAGGHRDFCVSFSTDTRADDVKDMVIDLPAGVVGDPSATPKCDTATFEATTCPSNTQVGTVDSNVNVALLGGGLATDTAVAGEVFNLTPTATEPARLGIRLDQGLGALSPVKLQAGVRVRVPDASLRSITNNIPNSLATGPLHLNSMALTLWGIHPPNKPFISLPTRCDVPAITTLTVTSYGGQTSSGTSQFTPANCPAVPFTPTLETTPKQVPFDEPGAASATLVVPGTDTTVAGEPLRQSYLRRVALQLPAGLALNPPLGNGLIPCTEAEFAQNADAAPGCPASSEIGTVAFTTPIFDQPLAGKVYFGEPKPGTFLRNFVSVEDPRLRIKLVGDVTVDPDTGAITNIFDDSPQVPFTRFQFTYNGGDRAVLTGPETCGTRTVVAAMSPWSATPTQAPTDTFDTIGCLPPAFAPTLAATLPDTQAGGDAALTVQIARPDRNLRLSTAKVSLPPGLTGRLPAVPACNVADARAGACADASQVGTAKVAVGTGPAPLSLPGKVYLTEGIDGSIAGLATVVDTKIPALDLGTVVVMSKLLLRPDTGIDVLTDPLPQALRGIPTAYRSIDLTIDKPGFMQNATSCADQPLHGLFTAVGGTTATADAPYAATGCDKLPFAPKLTASVGSPGQVAKGKHPALKVTIEQASGQAAMSRTVVSLPDGIGVDLKNLKAICTDEQLASTTCPASSKIGTVTADTPLLPNQLSGGAYLMQGATKGGLPGIALDLGLVRLKGTVALGRRLVTTFDNIPDVPLRRLVLTLTGGDSAVLATSKGLCTQTPTVLAAYAGHNGKTGNQTVDAALVGCPGLSGTGTLSGVAKRRPSLRLLLAATKGLKELRVKPPSAFTVASARSVRKSGRFLVAGKRYKGSSVSWSKGQIVFKAPKGRTSRSPQLSVPKGVLRLKRKVKVGSTQTFTVTGIRADGTRVSTKIKVKAAR